VQPSVRHQVFVSSTFVDLKEERSEVLQALWEMDCIPMGMEAFVAANESQWQVIQRVIEECDYYVLIIGGRYGSVTSEGMSYTEKEYNCAHELGIPVLCFVHGAPEKIEYGKVEQGEAGRLALEKFRARVMREHPVKEWQTPQELGGAVSRSLIREMKVSPRPGWVRNTGTSHLDLLEQINTLRKENETLQKRVQPTVALSIDMSALESGNDTTMIYGKALLYPRGESRYSSNRRSVEWGAWRSWDEIFRVLGPLLMNEATETQIRLALSECINESDAYNPGLESIHSNEVSDECFGAVIIQLRALGFIQKGIRKRAVSDRDRYWALTEAGDNYLVSLLASKKREHDGESPVKTTFEVAE
jgi:hypothetical protein